jgi:hypothetical protein
MFSSRERLRAAAYLARLSNTLLATGRAENAFGQPA